MNLTANEREIILGQLRDEAVRACRTLGCTCDPEPVMSLTDAVVGPHDLPCWVSDHDAPCVLANLRP